MSIINFAVAKPLDQKINNAIREYGFASKAEFFRFLAINFFNENQNLPLENDEEITYLVDEIGKVASKKFSGKTLPSIKDQLADL